MSVYGERRTRPGRRPSEADAAWGEWSVRVHGKGWPDDGGWGATRRRYWRNPRTKKTCVWAGRPGCELRATQLNHLTYRFSRMHRRYGPGWIRWPWYRIMLRPMCAPCHAEETRQTRLVRPGMRRSRQTWAHLLVTYRFVWKRFAVRWVLLPAVVLSLVLMGWVYLGGSR